MAMTWSTRGADPAAQRGRQDGSVTDTTNDASANNDSRRPPGDATGGEQPSPHDAVGAYLLDALPEAERASFERHLATCPDCRREVAELAPVAALLPRLLELEPESDAIPAPSPDLRSRILTAARADRAPARPADQPPAGVPAGAGERTAPGPRRADPPGAGEVPPVAPVPVLNRAVGWRRQWLAAAVLAVAAVGAIVWALVLQGRLSDVKSENARQAQQIAELRSRADAFGWTLAPTSNGPAAAKGQVLYSLHSQIALLYVTGLQPLPAGKVYQVWYLKGSQPMPGGTFEVNAQGQGLLAITTDVATYNALALTAEPHGGSKAPTSAVLMSAQLNGAAG